MYPERRFRYSRPATWPWWFLFLLAAAALAVGIVALYYPKLFVPPPGPCAAPLDATCIPTDLTLTNLTLDGPAQCSQPIDASCIPQNLTVNTITANEYHYDNITVINQTEIFTSAITVNNSMTCATPGLIDAACVDISGESCTTPLDASCFPVKDVQEAATNTTDSGMPMVYTVISGMSLIANNGGTGKYVISFNMNLEQSSSSAMIFVGLFIDGVQIGTSERRVRLETNDPNTVNTQALELAVPNGAVITAQWYCDGSGTIMAHGRSLIIQQV